MEEYANKINVGPGVAKVPYQFRIGETEGEFYQWSFLPNSTDESWKPLDGGVYIFDRANGLTQTIYMRIMDKESKKPMPGLNVQPITVIFN